MSPILPFLIVLLGGLDALIRSIHSR